MFSATLPLCIHWLHLPRYRLWGARAAAASCPIEVGCHAALECLGNEDSVVNDASFAPLITTQQSQHSVGLLSEGFIFLLTDEFSKKISWSPCAYRGKSQFRPQHTAEDMLQAIELLSQAIQLQDSKHASRAKERTLRMVSACFSSPLFLHASRLFASFCQTTKDQQQKHWGPMSCWCCAGKPGVADVWPNCRMRPRRPRPRCLKLWQILEVPC